MKADVPSMPLVSVCIPVYNRERLVVRAIESACRQTYENIEIIVSDNCSTDGTRETVRRLAGADSRIRLIENPANVGPTLNWQIAVNNARGEICKVLYSDDVMKPEFIEKSVMALQRFPMVAFVITAGCMGKDFDSSKPRKNYWGRPGLRSAREYVRCALFDKHVAVSPSCGCFRTADLKNNIVTQNPHFLTNRYLINGAGPDLLMFLETAAKYPSIVYLDEPLVLFGYSEDSFTCQSNASQEAGLRLAIDYAKARCQFVFNRMPHRTSRFFYVYSKMKLLKKYAHGREIIEESFAITRPICGSMAKYLGTIPYFALRLVANCMVRSY